MVQQSVNPVVTSRGEIHLLLPDTPIPRHRDLGSCLDVDRCSLFIGRRADAYGNTLIFSAPGADGVWFTDDDLQSAYGANEIIYCEYPDGSGFRGLFGASPLRRRSTAQLNQRDTETGIYYVRNRMYGSIPGTVWRQEPKSRRATGVATRVLQRDPIGYAGGVNLYEYVHGRAVNKADPNGRQPIIIGAGIGFAVACGISVIGGWFSGKSACQVTRECVCNGLGGAIAGGTLAEFPSVAAGCLGTALGSLASTVCESLWHCAGDPPGRSPLTDPCNLIKAGLQAAVGCIAGLATEFGEPEGELNKRLMGLLGSVFGLDCREAEKCFR
ncbi:MAG: RHS repeat protein [Phycisphaerae bacterium]